MLDQQKNDAEILVQVDKTVVKITGLSVKGLNLQELEAILHEKVKGLVRIIGVTGTSLEMDIYGVSEEDILVDEEGLIKAVSMAEGIKTSELTALASVEKIKSVGIDKIPEYRGPCIGERWRSYD